MDRDSITRSGARTPWGRAIKVARMAALKRTTSPTQSGDIQVGSDQRERGKQTRWARQLGASFGKAPSDRPALKPYWGKPAVRNFRGGDGNVGIIRSPVRAIVLPDNRHVVGDARALQERRTATPSWPRVLQVRSRDLA